MLEMPPRGNYVDRVVVSSPVHHHTLIGALSPNTRQLYPRSLNRALNLASLVIHQSDDDRVFIEASELRRVIVGFAEDGMKERFACALHYDDLASRPANFDRSRGNAIEVGERALDGLAVDISAGHEKLFPIREQETFEGLRRTSRLITEQQEKGN
jgi:hypothetical protein